MLVHVHVKFVIRENLAECYQRAEGNSQYLIARRPENIMISLCWGWPHGRHPRPEHSSITHDPLDDHRMPHRHRMNHGAASRKTQASKSSSSGSAQQDGEAENPRNIVRTCLKTPIEHLCFGARDHEIMRRLDKNGVVGLLATEVNRTGGQSSWARRERIDRTILNKVLRGRKPPTEEIIRALKLCNMYEPDDCGAAD
jgi:hypothetical protein